MGLRRTTGPFPRLWLPAETMIESPVEMDRTEGVAKG
jgi:hypothetical protein